MSPFPRVRAVELIGSLNHSDEGVVLCAYRVGLLCIVCRRDAKVGFQKVPRSFCVFYVGVLPTSLQRESWRLVCLCGHGS